MSEYLPIYIHTSIHILKHIIVSAIMESGTRELFITSLAGDSDALPDSLQNH